MVRNQITTSNIMDRISNDYEEITFVIPAKNEEKYIAKCIESILACEHSDTNVDICIVDNGSTDNTASIALSYGARVLIKPELSISALRNVGAASSNSKWIAFIDADVTISPNWINNAVSEMQNDEVAATGSSPTIPTHSNWVTKAWHLQIVSRSNYCDRDWLASMNMLVRRKVFEQVGGFDETLITCEDVDLGYRMGENYRIVYDKRIEAIHYGEAQSIPELFRKEVWRGSYNYRGLIRHGFRFGEIPSLAQPPITALGIIILFTGILASSITVQLIGLSLFLIFPIAKTIQTLIHTKSWKSTIALLIVWSTYSLARVWSATRELRSVFNSFKRVRVID